MSNLPSGYIANYPCNSLSSTSFLATGLHLKDPANHSALLSDISFTVECYKIESIADKTRKVGIHEALLSPDRGLPHTLAALHWVKLYGGKKRDSRKALRKFREIVINRPCGHAKYNLAFSLARILREYTTDKVNTSRNNGEAKTQDGVLAKLFQGVITLVDGSPLADPFPYLRSATTTLATH